MPEYRRPLSEEVDKFLSVDVGICEDENLETDIDMKGLQNNDFGRGMRPRRLAAIVLETGAHPFLGILVNRARYTRQPGMDELFIMHERSARRNGPWKK